MGRLRRYRTLLSINNLSQPMALGTAIALQVRLDD
jgi:hypothetical protein